MFDTKVEKEAGFSFQTPAAAYKTTMYHNPKYHNVKNPLHENLKADMEV
jgi:hypothetical protein